MATTLPYKDPQSTPITNEIAKPNSRLASFPQWIPNPILHSPQPKHYYPKYVQSNLQSQSPP